MDEIPVESTFYAYERKDYHAYLLEPRWGGIDFRGRRVDLAGCQYFARQLYDWPDSVGGVWGHCFRGWPGLDAGIKLSQSCTDEKINTW